MCTAERPFTLLADSDSHRSMRHGIYQGNELSIEIRVIRDPCDRRAVYRLRHRAYCSKGLLKVRPSGEFKDDFDDLPNQTLLGALVLDGRVLQI